jgi:redox-regulated HSP33 family molecular chaperone
MTERAPFSAVCPKCGQDRLLAGLSIEEFEELLDAGADIEGYCASCDEHWVISTEDRADIARALERLKKRR